MLVIYMILPTTKEELQKLNFNKPDIIIISGDTYIDSPFNGSAVIGNYLTKYGYKVAIIAQPDITGNDIARLGEPDLFWAVTAGAMDSLVANYTATGKFRNDDDLTPGGINNKRPDRASMVYTNLIRKHFKNTKPIILGGVEASLRRITHFDLKDNKLRRSVLFDAKADILVYGMGEKTILELANSFKNNLDYKDIKGLCYISNTIKEDYLELPSYETCIASKDEFIKMFDLFYNNQDRGLYQQHDLRFLIHNQQQDTLTQNELDEIADMDFSREVHPYYLKFGDVKAQETIKFSVISHRGCCGECNFCAISVHQGKSVISRSEQSILNEIGKLTTFGDFKGYISDVGGPTGNMYKISCKLNGVVGKCKNKKCLYPQICENLEFSHNLQIELLDKIKQNGKIKKVFVSSGIRHDLIVGDKIYGEQYLQYISENNISGQLKIAPEHISDNVLESMNKPKQDSLIQFMKMFNEINKNLNQYLTCYFMVAHPVCSIGDTKDLLTFIKKHLKFLPEQIQVFTPTPSTHSTLMYYTEKDLLNNDIFVEKDRNARMKQKLTITQNFNKRNFDKHSFVKRENRKHFSGFRTRI
ncbi:MAG: YgiQ family radical SAM protein [Endomicrobiaceae bacterium]|nr:YgiQ family radical SAM protein [Endomicrobiaceae bacterium]